MYETLRYFEFLFSDGKYILKSAYSFEEAAEQALAEWNKWQEEKIVRLEKELLEARNQKGIIISNVEHLAKGVYDG